MLRSKVDFPEPDAPVIAIDIVQEPCQIAFMGADNHRAGRIAGEAMGRYAQENWDCDYTAYVSLESTAAGAANEARMGGYRDGFTQFCEIINERVLDGADRTDPALTQVSDLLTALPGDRIVVVAINEDGYSEYSNGAIASTEALPGALPMGRNSPQRCAYGLYAEQLSGSPFTAPRGSNERSWLYRIRPSVKHSGRFAKVDAGLWRTAPCHEYELPIAQLRWDPAPIPKEDKTFLQGVQTMTTAGDANTQAGMAAHVYLITKSMVDQHFYNADGEMMFVAQQGNLGLVTEFGRIDIEPGEMPPTSAWWPRDATQKVTCLPSASKTGVQTVISGRCVPPL
jgi:hypothetical protein